MQFDRTARTNLAALRCRVIEEFLMLDLRVFATSLAMLVASMSIALAEPARDQPSAVASPAEARPIRVVLPAPWEPAKRQDVQTQAAK